MDKKTKRNTPVMIVLVLLAAIIIGGITGYVVYLTSGQQKPAEEKAKGVVGRITDGWDDGISDEPDGSSQAKSGTSIPGYSSASMNEGDMSLVLRVGNPPENKVGLIATVRLEDGTVLYESPVLRPGQGLEEIPLNRTLSKGEYNAEVYYQCVLLDDEHTPLNAAISAFRLHVN